MYAARKPLQRSILLPQGFVARSPGTRLGLEGFTPHSAIKNSRLIRYQPSFAHVDLESHYSQRGCVPASFSSKKMHPYLQLKHSSARRNRNVKRPRYMHSALPRIFELYSLDR